MSRGADRRAFLARAGLLGLATAVPGGPSARPAHAADTVADFMALLGPEFQKIARETIEGLVAFILPGDDRFSRGQGAWISGRGAVATDTAGFSMKTFDRFVPFPDRVTAPLLVEAAGVMGSTPLDVPPGVQRATDTDVTRLDNALQLMFDNDASVPASIGLAILLNVSASLLHPFSLFDMFSGFDSAFPRLSYREKAMVFADLESPRPKVLELVRGVVSAEDYANLDGLLKFTAAAVLALPALGAYSEWRVLDPATRRARSRPVGWDLARYLPGRTAPVDGHNELLGYYRNVR